MKNLKIVLIPILVLSISLLSSCATPYQSQGLTGGYKDMALSKNTYFVTFRGNGMTSANTVQKYALRRAAQLTVNNGYRYFIVMNGGTSVKNEVMQTPTTIQSQSNGYDFSGYGASNTYTTIHPGGAYNVDKYQSHITIKMLHSNRDYPQAFDANVILSNFKK